MDSSDRKVCILSPVFWRVVLMWIIVLFGFSSMRLHFRCLMSLTPKPVSFSVVIRAFVGVVAFWSIFWSASFVALITPLASPFG